MLLTVFIEWIFIRVLSLVGCPHLFDDSIPVSSVHSKVSVEGPIARGDKPFNARRNLRGVRRVHYDSRV